MFNIAREVYKETLGKPLNTVSFPVFSLAISNTNNHVGVFTSFIHANKVWVNAFATGA